jgi:hypothetical protein
MEDIVDHAIVHFGRVLSIGDTCEFELIRTWQPEDEGPQAACFAAPRSTHTDYSVVCWSVRTGPRLSNNSQSALKRLVNSRSSRRRSIVLRGPRFANGRTTSLVACEVLPVSPGS